MVSHNVIARINLHETTQRGKWAAVGGSAFVAYTGCAVQHPLLNISQLEAALGAPYRTARRYVEKHEEIGILREVSGHARNRIYSHSCDIIVLRLCIDKEL